MPTKEAEAFIRKHINTEDKELNRVLRSVLDFVQHSEDGFRTDELKKALCYLSALPMPKMLFNRRESLAHLMTAAGQRVVFDRDLLKRMAEGARAKRSPLYIPNHQFTDQSIALLTTLYLKLMEDYRELAWIQRLETNHSGQIMNSAVQHWQETLSRQSGENKALRDFARDYTINSVSNSDKANTENEIIGRIEQLVHQAKGYQEADKPKLVAWLRMNGGQDMNRFLDGFFGEQFLKLDSSLSQQLSHGSLGKSKGIQQNWTIENNKIVFQYDVLVSSVMSGLEGVLFAKQDGSVEWTDDQENVKKEAERWAGRDYPPALMRVKAQVELVVNEEGRVEPRLVKCAIASYTDKIEFVDRPELAVDLRNVPHSR